MTRLPAIPLVTSDPYFSIWMPADTMTETDTIHWSGPVKAIRGEAVIDGEAYRFLGLGEAERTTNEEIEVTPTRTLFHSDAGPVRLHVSFTAPALPQEPELMSMPVTLIQIHVETLDSEAHEVQIQLHLSDALCYDGTIRPPMRSGSYMLNGMSTVWCGQRRQKPLSHSGDRITIDWGYLYLSGNGEARAVGDGLVMEWSAAAASDARAIIAYDDIAAIDYFGDWCKAWYRRNGAQITDAILHAQDHFDAILGKCDVLDQAILEKARQTGGEDYARIVSAAWRHTLAAHKLIATPQGEMALLSKENDSNGCIGTVDVSYPSIPLFLLYAPELVNALCRPVLTFAQMPVWTDDFAPHDVGRYPHATGQVYAYLEQVEPGEVFPMIYLFPEGCRVYDAHNQMPVEECGNMLIMLEAAREFGADPGLAAQHRNLLDQWVRYLIQYGEDPGEQLCTDDFAGHLAHNVNLAAKAIVGVACYGRLTGQESYEETARQMAGQLMEKIGTAGDSPLTLDGQGWSMKYNLLWDRVLSLGLFPEEFYRHETESYLKRMNRYGLPLDSRADYTKSDWICWVARMAEEPRVRRALLEPIAVYLQETASRVPFSDWYDTKTGQYVHFIARSVQGGVFAPMLPQLKQGTMDETVRRETQ